GRCSSARRDSREYDRQDPASRSQYSRQSLRHQCWRDWRSVRSRACYAQCPNQCSKYSIVVAGYVGSSYKHGSCRRQSIQSSIIMAYTDDDSEDDEQKRKDEDEPNLPAVRLPARTAVASPLDTATPPPTVASPLNTPFPTTVASPMGAPQASGRDYSGANAAPQ